MMFFVHDINLSLRLIQTTKAVLLKLTRSEPEHILTYLLLLSSKKVTANDATSKQRPLCIADINGDKNILKSNLIRIVMGAMSSSH